MTTSTTLTDTATRRALAGLCTDCGEPARAERLLCTSCSVRKNLERKAKMRALAATGQTRDHFKCGRCKGIGHDRRTCDMAKKK